MTNQHPITPPPELVEEWWGDVPSGTSLSRLATQAAQWGADQELEAMLAELKALHLPDGYAAKLHAARRPKPPSLKEQALAALEDDEIDVYLIRRALEALDD